MENPTSDVESNLLQRLNPTRDAESKVKRRLKSNVFFAILGIIAFALNIYICLDIGVDFVDYMRAKHTFSLTKILLLLVVPFSIAIILIWWLVIICVTLGINLYYLYLIEIGCGDKLMDWCKNKKVELLSPFRDGSWQVLKCAREILYQGRLGDQEFVV